MIKKYILPVWKWWFQTQKTKKQKKQKNKDLCMKHFTSDMGLRLGHMIQTRAQFECVECVQQLREGICQSPIWDVFIWHDCFLLGFLSQSSPLVSLSPLKAAGPWPLQHWPSKPSSFQLRRRGTLPVPSHQQHPIQPQR